MTQENKISAVIITYNEEKNILRCLESVKKVADEIIVVDSFSTDATPEICREFNVVFLQNTFKGHVEQKNFAAQKATSPYVLSLDADELLSDELVQYINSIKKQLFDFEAYSFKRLNNYCGKWIKNGAWYPDRKIRLWQAGKGSWGGDNPHDKVIMNANSRVEKVNHEILHYSFTSISEHLTQVNKFSSIAAETAFNNGKRASILMLLLSPFFKFVRDYFFKAGFRDGFYGLVIAVISSHSKFLKYAKLLQKQINLKKDS